MRSLILAFLLFSSVSASAACPQLIGLYKCTGQTDESWLTSETQSTRFEYKTFGSEIRYVVRSGPNDLRMDTLLPFQTGRWRGLEEHVDLRRYFQELWVEFDTRATCSPSGELRLEARSGDPTDRSGFITIITPIGGDRIRADTTLMDDFTRPNPATDEFSRIECAPDTGAGRAG